MYTSIVLIALTGSVVASTPVENLAWEKNYAQARQTGQTAKKPLAVIFGSGQDGYDKLCRDGQLSTEVQKTLGDNYVCVYADVTTSAGKKLASEFAISRGLGIVLSDRSGNLQAFYHDGDMSNADLNRWVTRFADPNVTVRSTMTNDSAQVSMYPPSDGGKGTSMTGYAPSGGMTGYAPSGGMTGYAPSGGMTGYAPSGYAPAAYGSYGSFGGGFAPSMGGGCPGGNCGGGGGFRHR